MSRRRRDEESDGGSSESSSETDTEDEDDKSGKVQPRNFYQLEFDALLNDDGDQDDADEDNDDDDVSDSKIPNIAKSPQKCRRNPSKKKKKSAKEKDKETAKKKKNDPLPPLTRKEKPNIHCIAKAKCQTGSRHVYDDDVRAGRTRFCDRYKLLAHMNCTRVRQCRLICLLCFHNMKEEAARITKKPKEPEKCLAIPPSLCGLEESDDED